MNRLSTPVRIAVNAASCDDPEIPSRVLKSASDR